MDLSYTLPTACGARCNGCPHGAPALRPGEVGLDGLVERVGRGPRIDRLYLFGGDFLAPAVLEPLLGALGGRPAPTPDLWLYSPLGRELPHARLRSAPFVRGLIVPFLLGRRALHPGAPSIAQTLDRAIAARRAGLEILPYAYLAEADRDEWPKLVAALGHRLGPTELWLRLQRRPPAPLAAIVPSIALAADAARHHGIALRFDVEGPPPCGGGLQPRFPELFERLLGPEEGPHNDASPVCARCPLGRRCQWHDGDYLRRHGDAEIAGIVPVRRRHVSEHQPGEPLAIDHERWFVRRSELPGECIRPWTTMELMGIEPRRAAVCNEDWVRLRTPELEGGTLLGAWNGAYFRELRRAHGAGQADQVCRPHCLLRARRRSEQHRSDELELEAASEPFLRNLIRIHQAAMARAIVLEVRPIELAIGPTYRCNNACVMCHSLTKRRAGTRSELPPSFYAELAELLPTLRDLHVSGPGEPLLATPFVDFLRATDFAPFPDLHIHLTTNGALLGAELLASLERVPFSTFIVSLNAASAETYERVTGHDRFARVTENLRRLRSRLYAFTHRRPTLQLSFVVLRSNYQELPAFLELAAELRAGPLLVPIECDQHNAPEALWQEPVELGRALALLAELEARWRRQERVVQHLAGLRRSLELQARERSEKSV